MNRFFSLVCLPLFIFGIAAILYGYHSEMIKMWHGFGGGGGERSFAQQHPIKNTFGAFSFFSGLIALIACFVIINITGLRWVIRRRTHAKLIKSRRIGGSA